MSNSVSKTPNIFVRSLRELKSTRCLALTALLIAMNIALDLMGLELRLPPDLKIGFGFLANAAVGMLFGPSVAMLAGVCTDLLGYFAGGFTMGGYFPGFTLTAIVAGLFWGLWMYPRRVSLWRAIGAKVCINLFCNIGLNTLWLPLTGGKAMSVLLVARVPKNLLMLPVAIAVLYFGMKLVLRFYHMLPAVRSAERPAGQKLP